MVNGLTQSFVEDIWQQLRTNEFPQFPYTPNLNPKLSQLSISFSEPENEYGNVMDADVLMELGVKETFEIVLFVLHCFALRYVQPKKKTLQITIAESVRSEFREMLQDLDKKFPGLIDESFNPHFKMLEDRLINYLKNK